jgi:alanine racemase
MKGVDTLGLARHFDGTGYPWWKVLMEAYLQAKDLDVWRVTDEGMRNGTKKEKQFDVVAKSIILSSLDVGVFNTVFNCENAHELSKPSRNKMRVQKKLLMNATIISLRNSIALSNLLMKMPNLCTHA